MDIYLAGEHTVKNGPNADWSQVNILESFFYCKDNKNFEHLYKKSKRIIIDSGAFTFMNTAKSNVNWENYIISYANFINKFDIENFFELDIDSIVGLKKIEQYRDTLEKETGKKCIPVLHRARGLEYWRAMCNEYDYIAIGGIVTKEIKQKEHGIFSTLLKEAKGVKVHGLGYTNLRNLHKYPFYSVDSTSWLYGNLGGYIYRFNGTGIDQIKKVGRLKSSQDTAVHNFQEWVKFSKYAELNL